MTRQLTVADIADLRAYDRDRPAFVRYMVELKARRRVGVGQFVTFLFENRETIRFQVQEMARVEKLISDESIQAELDIYNPLIPEARQLSATLFVELTTADELRDWLPKLVGIERAARLRLTDGTEVAALVEPQHSDEPARDDVTTTVHYVRWELSAVDVDAFAAGPVILAVDHPAYQHSTLLTEANRQELLEDLRP